MTMRIRILAAVTLAFSLALPLSSVPEVLETGQRSYSWAAPGLLHEWAGVPLLLLVFFWPFAAIVLSRRATKRLPQALVTLAEPLAAACSAFFAWMLVDVTFGFRVILFVIWVPVSARPEIGYYVGLAANALYVAGWLADRVGSLDLRRPRLAT